MRQFCFLIYLIVTAGIQSKSQEIDELSVRELESLREKVVLRLKILDQYDVSTRGRPPLQNVDLLNVGLKAFLSSSKTVRQNLTKFSGQSESCRNHFKGMEELLDNLETRYKEFWRLRVGDERTFVQAKIEVLEILLKGQLTLIIQAMGETPDRYFPYNTAKCRFSEFGEVRSSFVKLLNAVSFLRSGLWGKRGVNNAYPLSSALWSQRVRKSKIEGDYALPKLALMTALFLVGGELMGPVIVQGGSLLRGTIASGAAALGAYRGYQTKDNLQRLYFSDLTDNFYHSIETVLSLKSDDLDSYYFLTKEIEESILHQNLAAIQSLREEINLAVETYGTVSNAHLSMRNKLSEIEQIKKNRKRILE